jgi:hypothetical protein
MKVMPCMERCMHNQATQAGGNHAPSHFNPVMSQVRGFLLPRPSECLANLVVKLAQDMHKEVCLIGGLRHAEGSVPPGPHPWTCQECKLGILPYLGIGI